ncbi:hypothetical protein [Sphingobacterium sp. LRF_L2]|uniref:hypothetical protein n=1 Tax=Sphingobacterium sp. LRF_L2 TaxID=3369421 RepID=UPI003F5FA29A
MANTIKKQLLDFCRTKNEMRIQDIVYAIQQAQDAIESDTKSSAGDKYETSREMIQQDLNRYQEQLTQAKKDTVVLQQIELESRDIAGLGSLVVTDKAYYFIAISLGKQIVENQEFMIISSSSPIGKLLVGMSVGESISFNGNTQRILNLH